MPTVIEPALARFAEDVASGLARSGQKALPSRYFYDDLGSSLFEAITLLPEYGLTRADERLLRLHSPAIAAAAGSVALIAELGSGSGRKTRYLLQALAERSGARLYRPIDVSAAALAACEKEINDLLPVEAVCADWTSGLREVVRSRDHGPLLVLFLGSTIGNLDRQCIPEFLAQIRDLLAPGDLFLLGADLVKDAERMIAAYDDPTGVTAAFNMNILGRVNRELQGDFDLRGFAHEVRWNALERRIEMHLLSCRDQRVHVGATEASFELRAGETIWTESSHKFTIGELKTYAHSSGFQPVDCWVDEEWAFAEVLWKV